jgi:hypothetical protein
MTEQEWLECADPKIMLKLLGGKTSDRKFRLIACACCRRIWDVLTDDRKRNAIEFAERWADNPKLADEATKHMTVFSDETPAQSSSYEERFTVMGLMWGDAAASAMHSVDVLCFFAKPLLSACANDLRCLFNSFRPVTIDPRWLTSTVVDLATAIYQECAFGRIPILADALMDAGCDNEEIIAHCRNEGPHVRGCWVVDLLLGKE